MRKNKNGLTFARQVPATEAERLTYEVSRDATIEGVQARIYAGAENTLRLNFKIQPANGSELFLVEPADTDDGSGKDYIDGDDDDWNWNVSHPVEKGDKIVVEYDNTDGSNAHNFRANMNIDYMGGTSRLLQGIKSLLGVG
jgi:hypothetical protein